MKIPFRKMDSSSFLTGAFALVAIIAVAAWNVRSPKRDTSEPEDTGEMWGWFVDPDS
tara:strand:- start:167 stop:337 length:171 start_codon:yes stop_codon:yes gene_type:complete